MSGLRVVFLDIDGVLNGERWMQALRSRPGFSMATARRADAFDPATIKRLNEILRRTGAKVVVSSDRRKRPLAQLDGDLRERGFAGEIIGATPIFPSCNREDEIRYWLAKHPVDGFVILDDVHAMHGLPDRLVATDPEVGLQDADVERAVQLLEAAP